MFNQIKLFFQQDIVSLETLHDNIIKKINALQKDFREYQFQRSLSHEVDVATHSLQLKEIIKLEEQEEKISLQLIDLLEKKCKKIEAKLTTYKEQKHHSVVTAKELTQHEHLREKLCSVLVKKNNAIQRKIRRIEAFIHADDWLNNDGFGFATEYDKEKYAVQLNEITELTIKRGPICSQISKLKETDFHKTILQKNNTTCNTHQTQSVRSLAVIKDTPKSAIKDIRKPTATQQSFFSKLSINKSSFFSSSPLKKWGELALKGDANAILHLADYYQTKNEYGRAILFSALAVTYETLPLKQSKYNHYLRTVNPIKFWSLQDSKNLKDIQSFFRTSLTQSLPLPYQLDALKKEYGISDPILLTLFALNNLEGTNYHNSIIAERITKSIQSFFCDALKLSLEEAKKECDIRIQQVRELSANRAKAHPNLAQNLQPQNQNNTQEVAINLTL
jgi:hypothetical protein